MYENNFGNKIAALRKAKGYTQAYVAKALGVTPAAVSKWENSTAKPRVEMLFRLAELLEANAEELLAQEKALIKPKKADNEPEKTSRRSVPVVFFSAVLFSFAVIVILIVSILVRKTEIPNLVGMNCVEAEEKLNELGLEYQAIGEYSETIPQNIVISQNAEAGSKVKRKSMVVLIVSKGRQRISMPQVIYYPMDYGVETLERLGMEVVVETCWDERYENDLILFQSVPIGEPVYTGTTITIRVNKKP